MSSQESWLYLKSGWPRQSAGVTFLPSPVNQPGAKHHSQPLSLSPIGPGSDARSSRDPAFTPSPIITDHQLIRLIGRGSYGEVWLARNVLGTYRAVKIVFRSHFEDDEPYDREFKGIQKFEPISRTHNGLVDVLQIGRNDEVGYFYYVMELADDAAKSRNNGESQSVSDEAILVGQHVAPSENKSRIGSDQHPTTPALHRAACYSPKTLRYELRRRGSLPVEECLAIGSTLTSALEHLHKNGLVHRDIKPSNIIFVDGVPKLADIGLVAHVDEAKSFVGTPGYIPPEGPGTPRADIYSLGKVLYEMSTGMDRNDFPHLPPNLPELSNAGALIEFNEVLLRACEPELQKRYACTQAMWADLELLQRGRSVRRAHRLERRWRLVRRGTLVLVLLGFATWLAFALNRFSQPTLSAEMTKRSTNTLAQQQYDIGRAYYLTANTDDLTTASNYFKAAAALDPNFLLARAAMAKTLSWGHGGTFSYYQFPQLSEAEAIGNQVLAKDDTLSDAHLAVAWHAFVREYDWKKATAHFEKAIRFDPLNSEPHEWYGLFLCSIGRTNQAVEQLAMAERLNGSGLGANDFSGQVLFGARRYTEAAAAFQKSTKLPGRPKESEDTELNRSLFWKDRTDQSLERWLNARYGAKEEWVAELRRVLQEEGQAACWRKLLECVRARTTDPLILAEACAMAQATDEALDLLEKAYREHHDFLIFHLKNDPEWDSLRSQPRFRALLKALNL